MLDTLPTLAGTLSTALFVASALPMLAKAFHTKDLASYSLGNIATANAGNLVHSIYVYSLPPGPIWLLHSFYLLSTALMLAWYLRYEGWSRSLPRPRLPGPPFSAISRTSAGIPRLDTPAGE